jgi:hypothetical protein
MRDSQHPLGGQMKGALFVVFFLAIIAGGCASTEAVKAAKGQGVSRAYPYAYEPVFSATLAVAKRKKLEVIESDKSTGRIILSHGVTWLSWGERIAVFLKPVTAKSTEVEIVSKPVMSPLNFPPDWQQILLEQIDVQLQAEK